MPDSFVEPRSAVFLGLLVAISLAEPLIWQAKASSGNQKLRKRAQIVSIASPDRQQENQAGRAQWTTGHLNARMRPRLAEVEPNPGAVDVSVDLVVADPAEFKHPLAEYGTIRAHVELRDPRPGIGHQLEWLESSVAIVKVLRPSYEPVVLQKLTRENSYEVKLAPLPPKNVITMKCVLRLDKKRHEKILRMIRESVAPVLVRTFGCMSPLTVVCTSSGCRSGGNACYAHDRIEPPDLGPAVK